MAANISSALLASASSYDRYTSCQEKIAAYTTITPTLIDELRKAREGMRAFFAKQISALKTLPVPTDELIRQLGVVHRAYLATSLESIEEHCRRIRTRNPTSLSLFQVVVTRDIAKITLSFLPLRDITHYLRMTRTTRTHTVMAFDTYYRTKRHLSIQDVQIYKKRFGSNFNAAFFDMIAKCENLTSLTFPYSDITDTCIASVVKLRPRVDEVDLTGCARITNIGVKTLVEGCPTLRKLNLGGCTGINGECVPILQKCTTLASLNLAGCDTNDAEVRALLAACPHLTSFHC